MLSELSFLFVYKKIVDKKVFLIISTSKPGKLLRKSCVTICPSSVPYPRKSQQDIRRHWLQAFSIKRLMEMGRGGFEPPTHGFSVHQPNDINNFNINTCEKDKKSSAIHSAKLLQKYPELQQIITSWPELPEHIKETIKSLIQVNFKGTA